MHRISRHRACQGSSQVDGRENEKDKDERGTTARLSGEDLGQRRMEGRR